MIDKSANYNTPELVVSSQIINKQILNKGEACHESSGVLPIARSCIVGLPGVVTTLEGRPMVTRRQELVGARVPNSGNSGNAGNAAACDA
jgi:hypothetical protein